MEGIRFRNFKKAQTHTRTHRHTESQTHSRLVCARTRKWNPEHCQHNMRRRQASTSCWPHLHPPSAHFLLQRRGSLISQAFPRFTYLSAHIRLHDIIFDMDNRHPNVVAKCTNQGSRVECGFFLNKKNKYTKPCFEWKGYKVHCRGHVTKSRHEKNGNWKSVYKGEVQAWQRKGCTVVSLKRRQS